MFRLVVLAVFCSIGAAINNQLDDAWAVYKKQHNKSYNYKVEEHRRIVWESNLEYIEHHNHGDQGFHSYRLEMNRFGDMTLAEIAALNGNIKNDKKQPYRVFTSKSPNTNLPNEVDWRKRGYVEPVVFQGQCASGWALAAVGSLEGQHYKKTGKLVALSVQNVIDCSTREGNAGCNGGTMDYAFQYIKNNNGIDTDKSYPYVGRNEKCHFNISDVGASITGYVDIPKGSEADLQRAVAEIGPIAVAVQADLPSFALYSYGVYNEPKCNPSQIDHGMLVVGYGVYNGTDIWIVKNSYGQNWGMNGYILMSRNKNNQCGIATAASFPLV